VKPTVLVAEHVRRVTRQHVWEHALLQASLRVRSILAAVYEDVLVSTVAM